MHSAVVKMVQCILYALALVNLVQCQINGDFWWMNSKLNNLKKVRPTAPKIDFSDFQNDESAIIFRDDDLYTNNARPLGDRTPKLNVIKNVNDNSIWPSEHMVNHDVKVIPSTNLNTNQNIHENKINVPTKKPLKTNDHMFNHDVEVDPSSNLNNIQNIYEENKTIGPTTELPKVNPSWNLNTNQNIQENKNVTPTIEPLKTNEHMINHDVKKNSSNANQSVHEIKIIWPTNEKLKIFETGLPAVSNVSRKNYGNKNSENICTYLTEKDCLQQNGLVYLYAKRLPQTSSGERLICCVLPEPATKKRSLEISSTPSPDVTQVGLQTTNTERQTNGIKKSQNICTYLRRQYCLQQNGFVYEYARSKPTTSTGESLICCVLPEGATKEPKPLEVVHFPNRINRRKRSDTSENIALRQREFLLKQKLSANQKLNPTPQSKIVTPQDDDYIDPYWNIKNNKFKNPQTPISNDEYSYDDEQGYTDEVPRPGLGLYSDHVKSPSSWSTEEGNKGFSYGGQDVVYDDVEEEDYNFGYSTVDPRKVKKQQTPKAKPQELTTTSDEVSYDAESQTVNFQSNPDFQVFQGFKLLNLFRNTSRVHNINSNKFTSEDLSVDTEETDEDGETFNESQLFIGCGKTKKITERGSQSGDTSSGSHPWLALVVLTKRRHNVLCYATLVHPRAAVTIADCVQGTAPGDISVIAGLWDLEDRTRARNRVATVHVHPRYKPGNADHNIAVLVWMKPLVLSANVQPACLGMPRPGDECKFFGWGGLEQGVQNARPRWQRASVRPCTGRLTSKETKLTSELFCVSAPRTTVTGMGGPLICAVAGRSTAVGVVVARDRGYVLTPVREWLMQSEELINAD